LYFPRFAFVHIVSMSSSNQSKGMESQTIHIIQLLCGPTLSCQCRAGWRVAGHSGRSIFTTTYGKLKKTPSTLTTPTILISLLRHRAC